METIGLVQRRQFVVDPKFQYGLILKCIFLVTMVLLVSLVSLTVLFNVFSSIALPVSADNGGVMSFGATWRMSVSDEIKLVVAVMTLSVIICAILVYIFGVSFSHKMAGPVFRLREFIAGMIHGDLDKKVSLRQNDYFQPLATDINSLRQHWHDSVQELQRINEQLSIIAHDDQMELLGRSSIILSDLSRKVS